MSMSLMQIAAIAMDELDAGFDLPPEAVAEDAKSAGQKAAGFMAKAGSSATSGNSGAVGQLQQTLEAHDRQHHPEGYKPGDTCKVRDQVKAQAEAAGVNPKSIPGLKDYNPQGEKADVSTGSATETDAGTKKPSDYPTFKPMTDARAAMAAAKALAEKNPNNEGYSKKYAQTVEAYNNAVHDHLKAALSPDELASVDKLCEQKDNPKVSPVVQKMDGELKDGDVTTALGVSLVGDKVNVETPNADALLDEALKLEAEGDAKGAEQKLDEAVKAEANENKGAENPENGKADDQPKTESDAKGEQKPETETNPNEVNTTEPAPETKTETTEAKTETPEQKANREKNEAAEKRQKCRDALAKRKELRGEVSKARKALAKAQESGDAEDVAEAREALAEAREALNDHIESADEDVKAYYEKVYNAKPDAAEEPEKETAKAEEKKVGVKETAAETSSVPANEIRVNAESKSVEDYRKEFGQTWTDAVNDMSNAPEGTPIEVEGDSVGTRLVKKDGKFYRMDADGKTVGDPMDAESAAQFLYNHDDNTIGANGKVQTPLEHAAVCKADPKSNCPFLKGAIADGDKAVMAAAGVTESQGQGAENHAQKSEPAPAEPAAETAEKPENAEVKPPADDEPQQTSPENPETANNGEKDAETATNKTAEHSSSESPTDTHANETQADALAGEAQTGANADTDAPSPDEVIAKAKELRDQLQSDLTDEEAYNLYQDMLDKYGPDRAEKAFSRAVDMSLGVDFNDPDSRAELLGRVAERMNNPTALDKAEEELAAAQKKVDDLQNGGGSQEDIVNAKIALMDAQNKRDWADFKEVDPEFAQKCEDFFKSSQNMSPEDYQAKHPLVTEVGEEHGRRFSDRYARIQAVDPKMNGQLSEAKKALIDMKMELGMKAKMDEIANRSDVKDSVKKNLELVRMAFDNARNDAQRLRAVRDFHKIVESEGLDNSTTAWFADGVNHDKGEVVTAGKPMQPAEDGLYGEPVVEYGKVNDLEDKKREISQALVRDGLHLNGNVEVEQMPNRTRLIIPTKEGAIGAKAINNIKDILIKKKTEELRKADPSLSFSEAETQASNEVGQYQIESARGHVRVTMNADTAPKINFAAVADHPDYKKAVQENPGHIIVPAGIGDDGKLILVDFNKAVHMLIAGSSGQGKGMSIRQMLTCAMKMYPPDKLRIAMIDPKNFLDYEGMDGSPHMVAKGDASGAKGVLQWLLKERDNREKIMKQYAKDHNIDITKSDEYNAAIQEAMENGELKDSDGKPMPPIVAVIDELADFQKSKNGEFKDIQELLNIARASGIHLVMATQSPDNKTLPTSMTSQCGARMIHKMNARNSRNKLAATEGAETSTQRGQGSFSLVMNTGKGEETFNGQAAAIGQNDMRKTCEVYKRQAEAGET